LFLIVSSFVVRVATENRKTIEALIVGVTLFMNSVDDGISPSISTNIIGITCKFVI